MRSEAASWRQTRHSKELRAHGSFFAPGSSRHDVGVFVGGIQGLSPRLLRHPLLQYQITTAHTGTHIQDATQAIIDIQHSDAMLMKLFPYLKVIIENNSRYNTSLDGCTRISMIQKHQRKSHLTWPPVGVEMCTDLRLLP